MTRRPGRETIFIVGPQPVAEQEHSFDLGTADREDMQVDVCGGAFEDAVLEPVGLPDLEQISGLLQVRQVGVLVRGVDNHQDHVDDWFGGEPGDRGRSHMLQPNHSTVEDRPQPIGLALEKVKPTWS
jgi:hypothetical protein